MSLKMIILSFFYFLREKCVVFAESKFFYLVDSAAFELFSITKVANPSLRVHFLAKCHVLVKVASAVQRSVRIAHAIFN
jgi:hypothetical protein